MALIEKFEINELKLALKNPFTYLSFAILCSPFYFVQINYNIYLLTALAFLFALILVIDIKEYIIPDTTQILMFLITCGLIYTSDSLNLLNCLAGGAFGLIMFGGIYYVYEKILKRSALGFGDVKLFANVGFILGFFGFNYFLWVLTVFSGCFIIVRMLNKKRKKMIPYGPFIVISTWICILFNEILESTYITIMSAVFA